jgi:hypothetical protein
MRRVSMFSLPASSRQSNIRHVLAAAELRPPSPIPSVLPGVSTGDSHVNDQQSLEAWLADLVGWGWQEGKGLRRGRTADPGLQEALSKQAHTKAVGHLPTSGGCTDNIDPANPQPATTAMRATGHHHQQTFWLGLMDRCRHELARHFGGRSPQSFSRRGGPKSL